MPKSAQAFRTISEAAEAVGAPQHVLRFWETKFPFVTPVKRAGGRRFYRPQDIAILKAIKKLLHDDGLTIKGVQKLHKEQGLAALAAHSGADVTVGFAGPEMSPDGSEPVASRPSLTGSSVERLRAVLADLEAARGRLDAVLAA
ncbi:MAG: MerR family transcriptional regulator [Caulobacteraceae bacterium]|nr:MerR family transcriptional regulator [Caulobacteraceae bacterium]